MKKSLLVLAAGMGSRYGGLKQMDPIGPRGEFILDYSIRDALAAGFDDIVCVVRRDIADDFRSVVAARWAAKGVTLRLAFQDLADLPAPFTPPEGRTKPWGTGHAILAARALLDAPFAVVNADDYYGPEGFAALAEFFDRQNASAPASYAMVAYNVCDTLSEEGSVSRGVCKVSPDGNLLHIEERLQIQRGPDGIIRDGDLVLAEDTPVSMNLFGFTPGYVRSLESEFRAFLAARGSELKSEFYIMYPLQGLLDSGKASLRVLRCAAHWFGVTNKADRPRVQAALAQVPPVW